MFSQPLVIGGTYRLKFKSIFERHGICTTPGVTCLHKSGGVFRLEQITNFKDLVMAGIKLYDIFFKPLGISNEDYLKYFDGKPDDEFKPEYEQREVESNTEEQELKTNEDGTIQVVKHTTKVHHTNYVETGKSVLKRRIDDDVNYASYPLYKFVDVIDSNDVIYVPELTIDGFPEIDINAYQDISIVLHLGYIKKTTEIDPMLLAVRERMAVFGWKPSMITAYTTGQKWLSPAEYDQLKLIRVPATITSVTNRDKAIVVGEKIMRPTDAIGQEAVVDGTLKTIVEPKPDGTVEDPMTQVSVNAITEHDQVLDNGLFLAACNETDRFVTGDTYYERVIRVIPGSTSNKKTCILRIMKEGKDYVPGDPCVSFVPTTEATATEFYKHFRLIEGEYFPIPYGHHSDYDISNLFFKTERYTYSTTTDVRRKEGKQYYVVETEDDGDGNPVYREATEEDFEKNFFEDFKYYEKVVMEDGVELASCYDFLEGIGADGHLYKLVSGDYVQQDDETADCSTPYFYKYGGSYYEMTEWYVLTEDAVCVPSKEYYIAAGGPRFRMALFDDFAWFKEDHAGDYYERTADPTPYYTSPTDDQVIDESVVLYSKAPNRYEETTAMDVDTTYVIRRSVYKENYGSVDAISLMGFKFRYKDLYQQEKSMTLKLEDIIDFAADEKNVTLPKMTDDPKFWQQYIGRRFKWTETTTDPVKGTTVEESFEMRITETNKAVVAEKPGALLGQPGIISVETYIKDDEAQRRNYYMEYVLQSKKMKAMELRIAALEDAVIQANREA